MRENLSNFVRFFSLVVKIIGNGLDALYIRDALVGDAIIAYLRPSRMVSGIL